ncbi:DNA alkylation repair protein [Saccharibacillus sacchari]|uniref:DNA alkylation repair protein n=1 Tax=Saccharibacillus sacchari TaxID=456493 RepID=A0ACC6PCB5_9BACL
MPEPLKLMYNRSFLQDFSAKVKSAYPPFQDADFVTDVLDGDWEELELKTRMRRISIILGRYLPEPFTEALDILYRIDESCVGFPYLFFPDFVEVHGQAEYDFDSALDALERFTSKSSSEFAIRVFLLRDPKRTMVRMLHWANSDNEHVRRLASEGCRPRLPWGQALPIFKADPTPVLEILEKLKADSSLYVRKSVANNLNDIAKDNPALVKQTARNWYGTHPLTDWIVRRGCRSLLKKADSEILSLFGYSSSQSHTNEALITEASLQIRPQACSIGGETELHFKLQARSGEPVRIRVEYAIDFVKASGRASRKLFMLADRTLDGGALLSGTRRHRFADLTTRKHYPGLHRIVLLVNGQEYAEDFMTLEPEHTETITNESN